MAKSSAATKQTISLIKNGKLALAELARLAAKPPIFEPGKLLFWDDEHISAQMLQAHLDPNQDAASRKPETIDRTVGWLMQTMGLLPGDRLLDLGCGPGLYSARFAQNDLRVTGIDCSRRSINYARQQASMLGLPIEYIYLNYLEIDYAVQYEAVVLIYGDFCTLPDTDRDNLLGKIYRALVPGGYFAFDVMTPSNRDFTARSTTWDAAEAGFWRSTPYLVLDQTLEYPDDICLVRHLVVDDSGDLAEYRIWNRLYTSTTATALVERFGFTVEGVWADLAGLPFNADSEWLGLVVRKPGKTK